MIAGSKEEPTKSKNFFQRIREISYKLGNRTTLDSQNFTTQIWFLPADCKKTSTIHAILELILPLIQSHPILKHFEVLSVKNKRCEDDLKTCIRQAEVEARTNGKMGLIVLTGKQISLGISLPCVDIVVMLNDEQSFDWNYQRMFRALTESSGKKMGFVIDFHPSRMLSTFYGYTNKTRKEKKLLEDKIFDPKESNLIFIDYDLFRMEEIDQKEVKNVIGDLMKKIVADEPLTKLFTNWSQEIKSISLPDSIKKEIRKHITQSVGYATDKKGQKKPLKDRPMLDDEKGKGEKKEKGDEEKKEEEKLTDEEIQSFIFSLLILIIFLTFPSQPSSLKEMLELVDQSKNKKVCEGNLVEAIRSRLAIWLSQKKTSDASIQKKIDFVIENLLSIDSASKKSILSVEKINIFTNKILNEFKERLEEMKRHEKDQEANIFNQGELICLIKDRLTPRNKEKKLFGEVFTPLWLVERMINKVPEEFYRHPEHRILGPSVGIGNFQVGLYYKLMDTLKTKIPNEEKRRKHILENMLYMIELNPDNKELLENILNPERKYKLNILCRDFLSMDILSEFGLEENFDMIIENPPYNTDMQTGRAKISLWDRFVIRSLELLKKNGYLVMVHPSKWRQPEHKMWDVLTSNQILYLELHDKQDGRKTFQSDTRYDWYVLQKTPYKYSTTIIDTMGKKISMKLNELNFLPNYMMEEIYQLTHGSGPLERTATADDELKVYYDSSTYGNNKPNKENPTQSFKQPVVTALNKDGPVIKYFGTDINESKQKGWKKVILSSNEVIRNPINDFEGKLGISNNTFGIAIQNEKQGKEMIKALTSKFFDNLIEATKWQTFQIDYHMFKYFDKNFYKHPLITTWNGLESVKNPVGTIPEEDDCAKISEIGTRVSSIKSPRTTFKEYENEKKSSDHRDQPISFIETASSKRTSPRTSPQRSPPRTSPPRRKSPKKQTQEELMLLKNDELKKLLKEKGLSCTGKKKDLVERLLGM
jgi:hypothetical protein